MYKASKKFSQEFIILVYDTFKNSPCDNLRPRFVLKKAHQANIITINCCIGQNFNSYVCTKAFVYGCSQKISIAKLFRNSASKALSVLIKKFSLRLFDQTAKYYFGYLQQKLDAFTPFAISTLQALLRKYLKHVRF